jgi:hypothetical protein
MASSDSPSGRDREVLASLPNARPHRRSAKRDGAGRPTRAGAGSETAKAAAGSARVQPRAAATENQRAGAGKATPRANAGAKRAPAAKPRAGAGKATPRAKTAASRAKPAPRSTAKAPAIPPAGYATPHADDAPSGADLVTTAVRAAGEIAQIGIAAGGRALKSALARLPRP